MFKVIIDLAVPDYVNKEDVAEAVETLSDTLTAEGTYHIESSDTTKDQ